MLLHRHVLLEFQDFVWREQICRSLHYLAGFAVSTFSMNGDSLDKFDMLKMKEAGIRNESIIMIQQLV